MTVEATRVLDAQSSCFDILDKKVGHSLSFCLVRGSNQSFYFIELIALSEHALDTSLAVEQSWILDIKLEKQFA